MFGRLLRNQSGAVGIIGALSLSAVIGAAALSVELGQGYMGRLDNQRVADMAALGAAMSYKAAGGGTTGQATLNPTARDVAKANGITNGSNGATVTTTYVASYGSTGAPAVQVDITTQVPIVLAKVVNAASSYTVHSTAVAGLSVASGSASGCITALSSGQNAISTSGGATIAASNCAINAVGGINNGGTAITSTGCATSTDPQCSITSGGGSITNNYGTVTANFLNYATSFSNPSWNTAVSGNKANKSTTITDPLDKDPVLYGADGTGNTSGLFYNASHISSIIAPTIAISDPTMPSCTYVNWNLTSSQSSSPDPSNVSYNNGSKTWTIKAGTYCINNFTTEGGMGTITFENGANVYMKGFSPSSPVTFKGGIAKFQGTFNTNSYAIRFDMLAANSSVEIGRSSDTVSVNGALVIADGPVTLGGAVSVGGAALLKMGTGTHKLRSISVGGSGALIAGPGAFNVIGASGVSGGGLIAAGLNTNGSILACPTSGDANYSANSYGFGGTVTVGSGGYFITCDGTFSVNGNLTGAGGGSRIVLGNTANHIINGNLTIAGSVFFGRGLYTIGGSFTNTTGGTTWPWTYSGNPGSTSYTSGPYGTLTYANGTTSTAGNSYDQIGVDVTFVASGVINLAGGAKTYLVAPTTTATTGLSGVLFATLSTQATSIGAGATNSFNGTIYVPKSDVTLTGGAGVDGGTGCFMLVTNTLTASGGTSTLSTCPNVGSGGGSTSTTGSIGLLK